MDRFVFEGFAPRKAGARRNRLEELRGEERTIVFYESPGRLLGLLTDINETLGARRVVVARELTKIYEEIVRGDGAELLEIFRERDIMGEVTVLVEGDSGDASGADEDLERELRLLLAEDDLPLKEAVKLVAERYGRAKKDVYGAALDIMGRRDSKR